MSDMRTQEEIDAEIDAEIARQDAFEDARSVESGGPSGLTIGGTEIGGGVVEIPEVTKTPAEILAEKNKARLGEVAAAANRAGGFVTGASQEEVDAILAGVESGIYSADDAWVDCQILNQLAVPPPAAQHPPPAAQQQPPKTQ